MRKSSGVYIASQKRTNLLAFIRSNDVEPRHSNDVIHSLSPFVTTALNYINAHSPTSHELLEVSRLSLTQPADSGLQGYIRLFKITNLPNYIIYWIESKKPKNTLVFGLSSLSPQ